MMNPVPWLQMTNMISYQGLVRTFLNLIVVAANNTQWRGAADQEFLIEALKSKRNEMHERLVKLIDAVGVVEKVIDGLVA